MLIMKSIVLLLLICFFNNAGAQEADSVTIRQVDSLITISSALADQKDFPGAWDASVAADRLALDGPGRISPAYAWCCFHRGRIFHLQRKFSEAEKAYLEALNIYRSGVGTHFPTYTSTLINLGIIYRDTQEFGKSESFFDEARKASEKAHGKDTPEYAGILNYEAILFRRMGEYTRAETLYLESIDIRLQLYGREHPEYATALLNLGNLYTLMGRYEKAEPLFLDVKAIRERTLGKDHPYYAVCLGNLAALYIYMGNDPTAIPFLEESLEIRRRKLEGNHPEIAQNLMNLAICLANTEDTALAVQRFEEARSIYELDALQNQLEYGLCLLNLASLYLLKKDVDYAGSLFQKVETIYRQHLGPNHPEYGLIQENMGLLARESNDPDKAERLHLEAARILTAAVGDSHPYVVDNVGDLVSLYVHEGQYQKAEPLFEGLFSGLQSLVGHAGMHLSEQELARYIQKFSGAVNLALSQAQQAPSPRMASICFNNALFYKGYLLQSVNRIRRLARSTPETVAVFDRLRACRRRLSQEYSRPMDQRQDVDVLEKEANALEKELIRDVAGWEEANRQVTWIDVRDALKPGEATVEFVDYHLAQNQGPDKPMVGALVVHPQSVAPVFVPLTSRAKLDSLLALNNNRRADYVNALYSAESRGLRDNGEPRLTLADMIWRPLAKELNGASTVYASSAGLLHRINLGAIPTDGWETVADRFHWVQLSSSRQLVDPPGEAYATKTLTLFGDIEYERKNAVSPGVDLMVMRSVDDRKFVPTDTLIRGGYWANLSSTGQEIRAIASLAELAQWKVSVFQARAATEEEFKQLGTGHATSARVIHLATHGFFFDSPGTLIQDREDRQSVFQHSNRPMLRSGLILAGGNAGWQGVKGPEGLEDGVLTADEISQLDLSGTELVVLSACETGLGDIQGNEGVYGLQRAFKIAGVKYLIMSLWQVPDKQTSLLMTTFYRKWLEEKLDIPQAFHAAQKEMRDLGFDPYQWAGFVLVE